MRWEVFECCDSLDVGVSADSLVFVDLDEGSVGGFGVVGFGGDVDEDSVGGVGVGAVGGVGVM